MNAYLWQTIGLLVGAFVIGALAGLILRRVLAPPRRPALPDGDAPASPGEPGAGSAMAASAAAAAMAAAPALAGASAKEPAPVDLEKTGEPVAPAPVGMSPVETAPVETAPVSPAPVSPAPMSPTSVSPAQEGPQGEPAPAASTVPASTSGEPVTAVPPAPTASATASDVPPVSAEPHLSAPVEAAGGVPEPSESAADILPTAANTGAGIAAAAVAGEVHPEAGAPTPPPPAAGVLPAGAEAPAGPSPAADIVAAQSADKLTLIRGIDDHRSAALYKLGITSFAKIAGWTASDVKWARDALGLKPGVIEGENWVEQAKILASGGKTSFAKDLELGRVAPVVERPDEPVLEEAGVPLSPSFDAEAPVIAARAPGEAPTAGDTAAGERIASLRSVRSPALRAQDGLPAGTGSILRSGEPDDLKRIKGIGVIAEKRLNAMGISTFEQIAHFSAEDFANVKARLDGAGDDQINEWVQLAAMLVAEKN